MVSIKCTIRPLITHIMGGFRVAFIMGSGDLMAQRYKGVDNLTDVDWVRLTKFASMGLFFVGPIVTHWYQVINPILSLQTAPVSIVMKRILNDQIYLAPTVNASIITMPSLVKIESIHNMEKDNSGKYASLMKNHYIFWPAVQLFSSIFIQPNLQLIFLGTIAVSWFAYVSEFLQDDTKTEKKTMELSEPPKIIAKNIDNSYFI